MDALIHDLQLAPHPEGGFFRETYRSAASTAIFYLLPRGQVSRLHRIHADEVWHFYRGDPLEVIELQTGGAPRITRLSADFPQHVVPAGTWFGSRPADGSAWSLVGCTVAPAFEFSKFELGNRDALLAEFPHARAVIEALT